MHHTLDKNTQNMPKTHNAQKMLYHGEVLVVHGQQIFDELRIVIALLLASFVSFLRRSLHAGQALGDLLSTQVSDMHLCS